jgi:uncharacterized membrane protein YozB (DUF420 family)
MTTADLPALNATLNACAAVTLSAALIAIKRGSEHWHGKLMGAAFVISTLFLISYLIYHATNAPVTFSGEGAIRGVYFFILITHIVLAAITPILVIRTLLLGRKAIKTPPGDPLRVQHRKWAKVTTPIWLYVSVTGVAVYVMLYQM